MTQGEKGRVVGRLGAYVQAPTRAPTHTNETKSEGKLVGGEGMDKNGRAGEAEKDKTKTVMRSGAASNGTASNAAASEQQSLPKSMGSANWWGQKLRYR